MATITIADSKPVAARSSRIVPYGDEGVFGQTTGEIYWKIFAYYGRASTSSRSWQAIDFVSSKTAVASSRKLDLLSDLYRFDDIQSVTAFLSAYPFLIDLLIEANVMIQTFFESVNDTLLELDDDPETGDGKRLYVVVRTSLPIEIAMSRLDELEQRWWRGVRDRARDLVTFDVD